MKLNFINMAQGVHKITEDFEKALCDYTGAPHAIALDNMSNALFLALYYEKNIKKSLVSDKINCPSKTYPSVPCVLVVSCIPYVGSVTINFNHDCILFCLIIRRFNYN